MIDVQHGALGRHDLAIIAHGGAGHSADERDGADAGCDAGMRHLAARAAGLDAAVAAVAVLEDDPRFNAGTGAAIRLDGRTIACDASVMDDVGGFGAVAYLQGVRHPVQVARLVFDSPHRLVVGEGAAMLAHAHGIATDVDLRCPEAEARYGAALRQLEASGEAVGPGWKGFDWRRIIAAGALARTPPTASDTVGAVVRDRLGRFAAASSTGGSTLSLPGRVGDVPIPGAGIFVSSEGGVVVTGHGESCIERMLAMEVHDALATGEDPSEALRGALESFPPSIPIGILALTMTHWAAGSNVPMPWAVRVQGSGGG